MEETADIFKRLYLPFHPKLYRIAFALVGNQEEAEEFQSDSSPEKETEEKDPIRQIQRWIDKLPLNQQQVLRLQGMEDYSVEEIEQITGYTAGNIRVLLSRARKTIREQFNKLYGK